MARWAKGQSGNTKGRPKGSLNKNNPNRKLQQALSNGYDMKDLKRLLIGMLNDDEAVKKMSAKDRKDFLKLAMETELKLMQMSFDHDETEAKSDKKESSKKEEAEDDDEDDVVFRLTAE